MGQDIEGGVVLPTLTEAVIGADEQPSAVAIIVKFVVRSCPGTVLFRLPSMGVPVPFPGIPVRTAVLSRVQEIVVPSIPFRIVIKMGVISSPGHICCDNGSAEIVGVGLIISVTSVLDALSHEVPSATEATQAV